MNVRYEAGIEPGCPDPVVIYGRRPPDGLVQSVDGRWWYIEPRTGPAAPPPPPPDDSDNTRGGLGDGLFNMLTLYALAGAVGFLIAHTWAWMS